MGRIGIGRIERGVARANEPVTACNFNDKKVRTNCKIVNLYQIEGLERVPVESAKAGRRNRRRSCDCVTLYCKCRCKCRCKTF